MTFQEAVTCPRPHAPYPIWWSNKKRCMSNTRVGQVIFFLEPSKSIRVKLLIIKYFSLEIFSCAQKKNLNVLTMVCIQKIFGSVEINKQFSKGHARHHKWIPTRFINSTHHSQIVYQFKWKVVRTIKSKRWWLWWAQHNGQWSTHAHAMRIIASLAQWRPSGLSWLHISMCHTVVCAAWIRKIKNHPSLVFITCRVFH